MGKGDIKIRVDDYLALHRDSEALERVRAWLERNEPLVREVDATGDFWTNGFAAGYQSLSRVIADAGEES